jgi:tungstate transport system permease protein
MPFVWESFGTALRLITGLDDEVFRAVRTSLVCALWSTVIASASGIPLGTLIGMNQFRSKRLVITLLNTLLALPTVVIGLVLYGILSRQGPLGSLGLLFTPAALIVGQSVLALPIITGYAVSAVQGADARVLPTALTLGCGPFQSAILLLREVKFSVIAAVIAGFGRVISEVGVAMMLGGNIRRYTRTMTTAIALETSKGEFAFGLALGIILLAVALAVNVGFNHLQQQR